MYKIEENDQSFIKDWALVNAEFGDDRNSCTIGWGSFGILYSKQVLTIYVKRNRYTAKILDMAKYFTVTFFDDSFKDELKYFGTVSKYNEDKIANCHLTVKKLENGFTYQEGRRTYVLRKIIQEDLRINDILDEEIIKKYYANEPCHTMYIGEIIQIS